MRVAVIDLGTNTFNLLIAEILPNKTYRVVFNTKIAVSMGSGGMVKKLLSQEAMKRGIEALVQYQQKIEEYEIKNVYAFATSAIREATNGTDFVKQARSVGIEVNVISGDKEAELIYKGVQLALEIGERPALIMDIGGGSTEFIIATSDKILWKQSFLLGVSRLREIFNPSDPVSARQIEEVEDYLAKELAPLLKAVHQFPVNELIGSAGSFDSFAEIVTHRFYSPDILQNNTEYVFNLKEANLIFEELIKSTKEQRLQIRGLIEMRVDMIVMAVLLTRFVLKTLGLQQMRLSTLALKEGVMNDLMKAI